MITLKGLRSRTDVEIMELIEQEREKHEAVLAGLKKLYQALMAVAVDIDETFSAEISTRINRNCVLHAKLKAALKPLRPPPPSPADRLADIRDKLGEMSLEQISFKLRCIETELREGECE